MQQQDQLPFSHLQDQEQATPDYENSVRIKFNMDCTDERVVKAATALTVGLTGYKKPNIVHMAVVLLNLYRNYLLDQDKWMVYVRRKENYDLVFKYNKNRIAWTSLRRVIDRLVDGDGLVDHALGFFYRGEDVEQGKCSRLRAKPALIDILVSKYGFTPDIIQNHPEEEIIILKDEDKEPVDYIDNNRNEAKRKRTFLRRYNAFLESTYLDVHMEDFQYRPSGRNKKSIYIDLSKRQLYRIFNNDSFVLGGRFYGGFWEEVPSALRKNIIVNNMKVVECDYSGVHIHLLYAREGIDYSTLGRDAYTLEGYPETPQMRQLFKNLLLAALNAAPKKDKRGRLMSGEERALKALRQKLRYKPDDYPPELPDLKEAMHDFSEYHYDIKHHFYTGIGLSLMYVDSVIAEQVLGSMMDKSIPVLPVHDSFVCPKIHEAELYAAMRAAYQEHCDFDISRAIKQPRTPDIKIKHEELDRQIEYPLQGEEEYHYDLTTITDEELVNRYIDYERTGVITKLVQLTLEPVSSNT